MAQGDVQRLQEIYAAINGAQDEALLKLLHPDFAYTTREEPAGRGSHLTTDVLRRVAQLKEMFRDIRFEPEEFISAGEGVVVVVHGTGLGRVSGAPVDERVFHVWTFRDAKAVALALYSDRARAVAAAGPS